MNSDTKYVIQSNVKFGPLEKIDIDELEKACPHDWFNQTLRLATILKDARR